MKEIKPHLAFLVLLITVLSIVTASPILASTNEEAAPPADEEAAPPADEEAAPPADEEEAQPASDTEGDDPNTEEESNKEDRTFEEVCWNGELVDDLDDCPEDEGNIVCNDGSFAVRISDCPTGSSPPPAKVPMISTTPLPSAEQVSKGAESAAQNQIPFPNADEETSEACDKDPDPTNPLCTENYNPAKLCPEDQDVPCHIVNGEDVTFDPDESCLFDVDQPKCTPPEGVDCPEGFGTNEDGQCFPFNEEGKWECPDEYHSIEDDESGQCYPDSERCPENTVKGDDGDCIDKYWCSPDRTEGPREECPDKDDEDNASPQSTTTEQATFVPDPNRFSPTGGGVYFPTESVPNPDRLKFGPFGIPIPMQTDEEFSLSKSTSTSAAEETSCNILGSADGILQKFDTAKYQACGLYGEGQKAYSDGFVTGCTQVGNTHLICQSFVDSSILNMNTQPAQTASQPLSTQEATELMQPTQPTQQGITPAAADK